MIQGTQMIFYHPTHHPLPIYFEGVCTDDFRNNHPGSIDPQTQKNKCLGILAWYLSLPLNKVANKIDSDEYDDFPDCLKVIKI